MLLPTSLIFAGVATLCEASAGSTLSSRLPRPPSTSLQSGEVHGNNNTPIPKRACGTGPPSTHLINVHKNFRNSHLKGRASPRSIQYLVDTYFHIVSTADNDKLVTYQMIANQFGALQAAYAPANISFVLMNTTWSINDDWATDSDDEGMKTALRQGNYSSLNIYFQTNLSTMDYGTVSQLLGYCTLPSNVTYYPCDGCDRQEFPEAAYFLDGCNVLAGSMPNGPVAGYNLGKTTVHEVGHWFGLFHTFQDETCAAGDPGDFIDDTPQESVATDGCPTNKDSCPNNGGIDPIHNYMDYSTDRCYESFSPEQIMRMHDMYGLMRFGN